MIDVHDQTRSFASVTQAQSHMQSFKGRIKKYMPSCPVQEDLLCFALCIYLDTSGGRGQRIHNYRT